MTPTPSQIQSEQEYRFAVRELTRRSRPPWVLRVLMNALESYRQARKMGWSRPQNKVGVTTFAAFALHPEADAELIREARRVLEQELGPLAPAHARFVDELLADPTLRGFLFVHDVEEGGRRHEGATVSLGRVTRGLARHRDRIDVIVEREVTDGVVSGATRVRGYVDPFVPEVPGLACAYPARSLSTDGSVLLERVTDFYARFRDDAAKAWSHWTQDYIDYFGPRTEPVLGTAFPTAVDELYQRHAATAAMPGPLAAARVA